MYLFDTYNVFLAIATNIPVLLMTAFVLQGHILVLFTAMNRLKSDLNSTLNTPP